MKYILLFLIFILAIFGVAVYLEYIDLRDINNINFEWPTFGKQERSVAKEYAYVNVNNPPEYSDYQNYEITDWGNPNDYQMIEVIGSGKYSQVWDSINVRTNERVAIKALKPIKVEKINREIKIMRILDHPHIAKLQDVFQKGEDIHLVIEYIEQTNLKSIYSILDSEEIRLYMYQLFYALDFAHSKGIMHRDVKGQNIMIDGHNKVAKLVDWGLAEFYFPDRPLNTRVASRYYKPPELLLNYTYYDYSLDVWSMGLVFASCIFNKEPIFMGKDNEDQLHKIVKFFGSDTYWAYVKKYDIKLTQEQKDKYSNRIPAQSWDIYKNKENEHLTSPEALDLIQKMMVFDQAKRITMKEALLHPYFAKIREDNFGIDHNASQDYQPEQTDSDL